MAMNSRRAQWVVWNNEQGLADSEKAQGRNNIGAAALASLAPAFSTSTAYNEGAVVTYNGALYIFDSAHAAGAWTGADAHEVTILEVLAMSAEKKKFVVLGTISGTCEYEFTGNARNAQFSPSGNGTLATMAISTADNALAGFKAGTKTKIKGFMVRSVKAEGLATATVGAASLDFKLSAVDDNGLTIEMYNDVYIITNVQWNRMEYKDIDLQIPDTLPSGATGFMLTLLSSSKFYVDDYNVQSAYIGQKVTPEIVMDVECDKMVNVLTGTDIV